MFRAFSDSAPDTWGRNLARRAAARSAVVDGATARTLGEVDFLLDVRDDFRQGALRFRDGPDMPFLNHEDWGVPQEVELPRLLREAEHYEEGSETDEELMDLLRAGSSLGGARPKAHVVDANGELAIAKFPSVHRDTWNVGAWEKVALELAGRAGVNVPDSRLLHFDERSVLVVNRFDRRGAERIGYASAMTMVEAADGDTASYLDIVEKIEEVSPAATKDLRQLWRRIAFGILISNTDDHLRNHGFLHASGTSWSLSPAFDLNPNPDPGVKHLRTAIDQHDTTASVELLMSVAEFFRLDESEASAILGEVVLAVGSWRDLASNYELAPREMAEMAPAFESEQLAAARSLTV